MNKTRRGYKWAYWLPDFLSSPRGTEALGVVVIHLSSTLLVSTEHYLVLGPGVNV
jgi:hypothetical protein